MKSNPARETCLNRLSGYSASLVRVALWISSGVFPAPGRGEGRVREAKGREGVNRTIEGWRAREEHVADDSQRPHIAPIVIVAGQHLRGGVVARPHALVHALVGVEVFAQAEVDHDERRGRRVALEQKVLELEVAVDDALAVEVVDAGEHVSHQARGAVFAEDVALVLARGEELIELSSSAQVSHEVDRSSAEEDVLELDDVGMVHLAEDLHLRVQLPETRERRGGEEAHLR
jgi:hypothetical protein